MKEERREGKGKGKTGVMEESEGNIFLKRREGTGKDKRKTGVIERSEKKNQKKVGRERMGAGREIKRGTDRRRKGGK